MSDNIKITLIIAVALIIVVLYYAKKKSEDEKSLQSGSLLLQALALKQQREKNAADKKVTFKDALGFTSSIAPIAALFASDINLKQGIVPLEDSISKFNGLNAYRYKYSDEFVDGAPYQDRERVGFIAQQVEEYFPSAVFEHNGTKFVDYSQIVPVMVEVLRDQQNQINKLTERPVSHKPAKLFN